MDGESEYSLSSPKQCKNIDSRPYQKKGLSILYQENQYTAFRLQKSLLKIES